MEDRIHSQIRVMKALESNYRSEDIAIDALIRQQVQHDTIPSLPSVHLITLPKKT